jgi:D-3-phosphoglycerate dehydrogenase
VDALHGRTIANAVNIPSISLQDWKAVEPYYRMAENLGRFAGQFFSGAIKAVEITYGGGASKLKADALTRVLLKELLTPRFEEQINEVNVLVWGKEKGIKVSEARVEAGDFSTHIGLKVETDSGARSLEAALAGNGTQIVNLDGFPGAIPTQGSLVIFFTHDEPGMIGKAATALGEAGDNIASLTNGRKAKGGEAVTVINVDGEVGESVIGKLKSLSGVKNPTVIRL